MPLELALMVPLLLTPPETRPPVTVIAPELVMPPAMVLLLVTRMPEGPPGVMVPALTTLPLTVAALNVTHGVVCPAGLVKPALLPVMVLAQAAHAAGVPAPISSAAAEVEARSPHQRVHRNRNRLVVSRPASTRTLAPPPNGRPAPARTAATGETRCPTPLPYRDARWIIAPAARSTTPQPPQCSHFFASRCLPATNGTRLPARSARVRLSEIAHSLWDMMKGERNGPHGQHIRPRRARRRPAGSPALELGRVPAQLDLGHRQRHLHRAADVRAAGQCRHDLRTRRQGQRLGVAQQALARRRALQGRAAQMGDRQLHRLGRG